MSVHQWKRPTSGLNRRLEKLEDLPVNLFSRRHPITVSQKRELYENGIPARATILKRPSEKRVSRTSSVDAPYQVRIEIEGQEPYEAKTVQTVGYGLWSYWTEGSVVEARVDRSKPKRILLVHPEPHEVQKRPAEGS